MKKEYIEKTQKIITNIKSPLKFKGNTDELIGKISNIKIIIEKEIRLNNKDLNYLSYK